MPGTPQVREGQCPFCEVYEPCEHMLLVFDETAGAACNGPLADAFTRRLDALTGGRDGHEAGLRRLLAIVEQLATCSASEIVDGLAIQECVLRTYYCASADEVEAALREFGSPRTDP